jgi:hypothetical protein
MLPLRLFKERSRPVNLLKLVMDSGMIPVRLAQIAKQGSLELVRA